MIYGHSKNVPSGKCEISYIKILGSAKAQFVRINSCEIFGKAQFTKIKSRKMSEKIRKNFFPN